MLKKRIVPLIICLFVLTTLFFTTISTNAATSRSENQIFYSMSAPAATLDFIDLSNASFDEKALFVTLQGIVNKTQPRIYVWYPDGGGGHDEGKYTWLQALGLGYTEVSDKYSLISKYKSEVSGLVIYDPNQIHTLNLATTIAGIKNGIVVSPTLAAKLEASPYNFTVLDDLRGRFSSVEDVYNYAYDQYWSQCTHDYIIGLDPDPNSIYGAPGFSGFSRDYAVATKAMVVYLNSDIPSQDTIFRKFLNDMPKGKSAYLGWYNSEPSGVGRGSEYGVGTVAGDRLLNLSVLSGMPRAVTPQTIPAAPALENKIYVSVIISDGDNAQFCQHQLKYIWDNTNRGVVPLNYTVSPTIYDLMPKVLNHFLTTATSKDCLIAGPSGSMYVYPDRWNSSDFGTFCNTTNNYMSASGLRVITNWGSNAAATRQQFSGIPSLLGVTYQNILGGGIYMQDGANPINDLVTSYAAHVSDIQSAINGATANWDGTYPKFVGVQYIGWDDDNAMNDLVNYLNNLNNGTYKVVRADNFFQLMKQANQHAVIKDGTYEFQIKSSGKCVDVYEASTANNASVVQWDRLGGANQRWNVTATDSGYYKIINENSGKALVVDGASTEQGAKLLQYDYGSAQNDQWAFISAGNGYYKIVNRKSGWTMDVTGNVTTNGARIEQWLDQGQTNQVFKLVPVPVVSGATYKITAGSSGKVIEVFHSSTENNAIADQYTLNGSNTQKWVITATEGQYYKIINANSGKALAVSGASTSPGALILQYDYGTAQNDQWSFVDAGNGFYKIVNRKSGLVLDIPDNSVDDGVQLIQYTDLGQNNQMFQFTLQ